MTTTDQLTERQREILRTVVECFIQSATPVGSRHLAEHFFVDLSPATIRNALAELEEKGYVGHPYTSAGRVPTDMGYRAYVDGLMTPGGLSRAEKRAVESGVTSAVETAEVLQEMSKILGRISHQLGIVSSPHISLGVLEKLELISVSNTRLLVILTMKSGIVKTITMEVPTEVPRERLDHVSRLLNERITGLTLLDIRQTFADRVKDLTHEKTGLIRMLVVSSAKLFDDSQERGRLYISGTKNILDQPEFESPDRVRSVIEILENEDMIIHVLENHEAPADGVSITIGSEHRNKKFEGYSLILSTYRIGDVHGTLGLFGPKRMNYERIVPLVDYAAQTISHSMS